MKMSVISFLIGAILAGAVVLILFKGKADPKATARSKIVYSTVNTQGYYFPTHNNLLVMDRSYAEKTEVFVVEIAPRKATHHHIHNDTEQLYYVLSGNGIVRIERDGKKEQYVIHPTEVVHIPRNCYHQTFCNGSDTLRYLAIDCFPDGKNPAEPTWDDHARVICKMNSWDYKQSRLKQ